MMSEFVDADVSSPSVVDCNGRVLIENSSAAISLAVDQDLDELIGRKRRNVAQVAVLHRQHIAFAVERVIGSAERGTTLDSAGGRCNPGVLRRSTYSPHVHTLPKRPPHA